MKKRFEAACYADTDLVVAHLDAETDIIFDPTFDPRGADDSNSLFEVKTKQTPDKQQQYNRELTPQIKASLAFYKLQGKI